MYFVPLSQSVNNLDQTIINKTIARQNVMINPEDGDFK
jgi:hypothetical protein